MPCSLFLSRYLARSAALFRKGPWRQEKGGRKREEGKHSVFVIKRCFHWGMCALAVDCFLLAAYLQGFWLRAWLELFFTKERERKCQAWWERDHAGPGELTTAAIETLKSMTLAVRSVTWQHPWLTKQNTSGRLKAGEKERGRMWACFRYVAHIVEWRENGGIIVCWSVMGTANHHNRHGFPLRIALLLCAT